VITKPKKHEINRAGKLLFRSALEQLGWVVNDVQEDYGIDSNVQVFGVESPTGTWFHVQLKSSGASRYSKDGKFVSQRLSMDHARHYVDELRQPVFVVHADVVSQKVYWYAPQLTVLPTAKAKRKSISIEIPTRQILPDTAASLMKSLGDIHLVLANRELTVASNSSFSESLKRVQNEAALHQSLQDKNDILKLRKISQFYQRREYADARPRAEAVSRDPDASIEMKVWALTQLGFIDSASIFRSSRPQTEMAEALFERAQEIRKLTRSGPRYLKFYALIMKKAAELHVLSHEYFTCVLAGQAGVNPALVVQLNTRKSDLTRRITAKYNQCLKLLNLATRHPDRWMLSRAFIRIAHSIGFFMMALRIDGKTGAADGLSPSALSICKLSASIDETVGDEEGRTFSILTVTLITESATSDAFQWALAAAQKMTDGALRTDLLLKLDRAKQRWAGTRLEADHHGDTIRQAAQNIATALGIDTSDCQNPEDIMLRIAAKNAEARC
jgi:hypothetical protein